MSLILSWENWSDQSGVTIETDTAAGTLPVGNVTDPIIGKVWRALATTAYLQVDLGEARDIDFLILAGLTMEAADTIRLRIGTSIGGGQLYDSTAVASNVDSEYGIWAAEPVFSGQSARYVRLDFSVPSRATETYFDVGRLWIGDAFEPRYSATYGYEEEWLDFSNITFGERSGTAFPRRNYQKRRLSFALDLLSETEALDEMREMSRAAGLTNQVACIPKPGGSRVNQEAVIGRFSQTSPIRYPNINIFSKVFEILEDK